MPSPIALTLARTCVRRRSELDATQRAVADAIGISRSYYAAIESARANPTTALLDRIAEVLGVGIDLAVTDVIVVPQLVVRDALHARCSSYVARRLVAAGWLVLREVAFEDARYRGWIDLLAYDPRTGTVLVIEVKTSLDDVGRLERQLGWYVRLVERVMPAEWEPRRVLGWALLLATSEVDDAISRNRQVLAQALPDRAGAMRAALAGDGAATASGLALIDPRSRRRDWLIPSRVDGRRTPLPYLDRAGATRILGL